MKIFISSCPIYSLTGGERRDRVPNQSWLQSPPRNRPRSPVPPRGQTEWNTSREADLHGRELRSQGGTTAVVESEG